MSHMLNQPSTLALLNNASSHWRLADNNNWGTLFDCLVRNNISKS